MDKSWQENIELLQDDKKGREVLEFCLLFLQVICNAVLGMVHFFKQGIFSLVISVLQTG
jgi:hypothetical protein